MSEKIIRIGGASGAWGDSPRATAQLLRENVQYLMMDYLAEVTMSLLARARLKDPEAGFPPDFVGYLKPHLKELAQRGIKVVSNAGGVNPAACKRALEAICAEQGLSLRVAVVEGDDLIPMLDELRNEGVREWVSGAPIPARMLTANAYLGAVPIAAALDAGADIVITGRSADSALALGILMHEYGWQAAQLDLMAAGSLVGHVLECGPQATGGVFTDWEEVPDWHNIGYPIAECKSDGTFVVTKPADTGGLVSTRTIAEQVLYEIGDPAAYFLPDVTADFSAVHLEQLGPNRVGVSGVRGRPPTSQYKVSATYQDGFRAVAMLTIVGVDAVRKAERSAEALLARARMIFAERKFDDFTAVHVEVIGGETSYGDQARARGARDVLMRLVVEHKDPKALDAFARELGSAGLSFAQGTTGLVGGRPKAGPVIRLYTFFIDKKRMPAPLVTIGPGTPFSVAVPLDGGYVAPAQPLAAAAPASASTMVTVPLIKVAHARSGDKGDLSNIAIYCRKPEYVAHLRSVLTADRVLAHFAAVAAGPALRYEAPGLAAFNFVIDQALGGGGMASLRSDFQGKAYGQRALEMMVDVPASWGV